MARAYADYYLEDGMMNLGEAVDYAVNLCQMAPDDFMEMFVRGGIADRFGDGVPKYICGLSGTELAMKVIEQAGIEREFPGPSTSYDRSPEYWAGWALAYYQWHSGRSFREIMSFITMEEIISLYFPLHEASEEKFADTLEQIIKQEETNSKR